MIYLVTGAGSGFGRAISKKLAQNGHQVIAVSRGIEALESLRKEYPDAIQVHSYDLTKPSDVAELADRVSDVQLDGIVLNAGGPPTMSSLEATPADWDKAWELVFKWKVELCRRLVPAMVIRGFGRVLFIESVSVKQPLMGLVLSNAVRAAVMGYARTLSKEVARRGVTVNCLLPGSHDTSAIERVIKLRSEEQSISEDEARKNMAAQIPVGRLGSANEIASLAAWVLSAEAGFVTGQGLSHDGGAS